MSEIRVRFSRPRKPAKPAAWPPTSADVVVERSASTTMPPDRFRATPLRAPSGRSGITGTC